MARATRPEKDPGSRRDRLVFGAILVAVIAGLAALDATKLPGVPTTLIVGILAILVAAETAAILRASGADPFSRASLPIAIALVLLQVFPRIEQAVFPEASAPLIHRLRTAELAAAGFLAFAVACVLRRRVEGAAQTLGAGTLVILVPACLLTLIDIRFHYDDLAASRGLQLLLFLVAVSKSGDVAAYFIGSRYGKRKLIPAVSPGKTWEGGAASLGASLLVAAAMAAIPFAGSLSVGEALVAGVFVNVASQFGDLTESLLKRSAKVKDSGRWIPQFGGAFDLVDSLFLAGPVFYGCLRFLG